MTDLPQKYHAEVVDYTEALLAQLVTCGNIIAEGLEDRPKPGSKAKARTKLIEMYDAIRDMWRFIEGHKPLELTTGDEQLHTVQPSLDDLLPTPEAREAYDRAMEELSEKYG